MPGTGDHKTCLSRKWYSTLWGGRRDYPVLSSRLLVRNGIAKVAKYTWSDRWAVLASGHNDEETSSSEYLGKMVNRSRGFVIRHLREALVSALTEADGNETLSRHLHARAKLRLITMSDEELQELAKLVACPPERPVEMVYQGLKGEIEELKQTANEWMKDVPQNNTTPDPEEGMHYRVLIVENEPSLRQELVSAFTQVGFIVVDVPDYSQTLQRLYEFKVDLVVMDSFLPDWDGFEACSELRSRFDIPVILLGQDSGDRVWERVMEADADHYEVKPCRYLALVARAKAILRRYRKDENSRYGRL